MCVLNSRSVVTLGIIVLAASPLAAEQVTLQELLPDNRAFAITTKIDVSGTFETPIGNNKTKSLAMKSTANFSYLERRLSGSGRDARAFRSIRYFRGEPGATTTVDDRVTASRLADHLRLVVAEGRREGFVLYTPNQLMRRADLDLLTMPADGLGLLALLPAKAVEVGDDWSVGTWVPQLLMGVEAVVKAEMKCKLMQVSGGVARVDVNGSIEGAVNGSATNITLAGYFLFNVADQHISSWRFEQNETRTVGTVNPGMKVKAVVTGQRQQSNNYGPLNDTTIASIPLEPSAAQLQLLYVAPWKTRFIHDRDWHIFHQTKQVSIMRLLDRGALIAQLNLSPIESVAAGSHTAPEQFVSDISTSLGAQLKSIESKEPIRVNDDRFLYRVHAKGMVGKRGMNWIYFLCAAPSGRQVSMVFTLEDAALPHLKSRDSQLASTLTFLE